MPRRYDYIERTRCDVNTAATMLGISTREIVSLCKLGVLRSYGGGTTRRIFVETIEAYKAQQPEILGGYIYLIRWNGYYKIGKAVDVPSRIREIGCSHPIQPELIKVIPTNAMTKLEGMLHKRFAHKRVSGEWFDLSDDEVLSIRRYPPYVIGRKTLTATIVAEDDGYYVDYSDGECEGAYATPAEARSAGLSGGAKVLNPDEWL